METLPLHPSIFNLIIYVICPAVAILQWIIIAPLAREKKVWDSLEGAEVAKGVKHKLPFLKDGFFILWNIFPLFLLGIYIYMGVNWFNWQGDLLLLNDSLLPDIYYRIYAFRFNTFVVSAIVLFSLYSALWQKTKQGKFIANVKNNVDDTFVYWWDIRISKPIFYIRMFALFFNMFTVLYILLTTATLFYFIYKIVNISHLNLTFFHPDNAGGLNVIGNLSIVLSSVFLFTSGLGLAAIFDHKSKQGLTHTFSDTAALMFIVPALFILIYPAIINKERLINEFSPLMVVAGKTVCYDIPAEYKGILGKNPPQKDSIISDDASKELGGWLKENAPRFSIMRQILQINYFPINWSMFISLVTTWLAPLFIWIFFKVYASRNEKKE